jgi:hypothetical protein
VPEALRFDCPPANRLALEFADLAPPDFGGDYSSPVEPGGRPAERLVMHRQDHAKKLWAFLLKKREPAPSIYVFADSGGGDRRALSLAYAVADVLQLPRQEQVYCPLDPEARHEGTKAPNPFVYDVARQGRGMVIA